MRYPSCEHLRRSRTPVTALDIFICPRIFIGIPTAQVFDIKERSIVETIITSADKSSSQSSVDWPILTFWAAYLSIVFGILYAVVSEAF
jgi:hypothetical protein